jgi:hypothetical protein
MANTPIELGKFREAQVTKHLPSSSEACIGVEKADDIEQTKGLRSEFLSRC